MAAEQDMTESLDRDGFVGLRKDELFALLDYCCDPRLPIGCGADSQIITGLGAIEQDRDVYWTRKPLFRILRSQHFAAAAAGGSDNNDAETPSCTALLSQAPDRATAEDIILQALTHKLSTSLGIPPADVDPEKPIHAFGIDSMVALEVRYRFGKEMRAGLSTIEIMQAESLVELCRGVAEKSELCG